MDKKSAAISVYFSLEIIGEKNNFIVNGNGTETLGDLVSPKLPAGHDIVEIRVCKNNSSTQSPTILDKDTQSKLC